MRTKTRHVLGLALVVILPLLLSGCYRSVGGRLEPTPSNGVGLVSQQNTPLPQPTFTPLGNIPTAEQFTPLPTALASPSPFPTMPPPVTNTPLPTQTRVPVNPGQGGPLATNTPVIIAAAPTSTPFPTQRPPSTVTPFPTMRPSITPFPTQRPFLTNTPLPTSTPFVAVPVPTNPLPPTSVIVPTATFTSVPFQPLAPTPTYTPFIPPSPFQSQGQPIAMVPSFTPSFVEAQPLGERPTETLVPQFGQPVGVVPTFTPPPQPIAQYPTLTGGQMTATQMVYAATATVAAALGIQMPTFTPMPGQPVGFGTPLPPNVIIITATPTALGGICAQYQVQINDTLYRIAARYGVTAAQIALANNITNPDLIKMGATLNIPCPVPSTATPVVIQPTPGQVGTVSGNIYTVQQGDNIYQISLRFGVSMDALMAANGMNSTSAQSIYVGQQIVIPPSAANLLTPTPMAGQPIYIIVTNTPGFSG